MAQAFFRDSVKAAEDAGFSNTPPGTYGAKVFSAEATKTGSGKHQLKVKFEIIGGPHGGRKVPNNFVYSPENGTALGFFFKHMRAFGLGNDYWVALDGAYQTPEDGFKKAAADLIGRECQVVVGEREWGGEMREDVKDVRPPIGGAASAPSIAPSPFASASAVTIPQAAPVVPPVTPVAADMQAPKLPF